MNNDEIIKIIINNNPNLHSEDSGTEIIKNVIENIYHSDNLNDVFLMHGIKNISNEIIKYLEKEQNPFMKINPIKRDKIKKACEYIKKYPFVKKMIIFGSSVTPYCTEESDIDICLVTDKSYDSKKFATMYGELPLYIDDLCDILIYDNLNEKWKNQIDTKGVVVYESEKN